MARKLIVEVLADVSKYVSGFKEAARATNKFDAEVTELNVDTQRLAQVQVAASTRTIERLRQQSVAYRQVAATAKHGSTEQAAATRLAARAEAQLARETGVVAAQSRHAAREQAGLVRQINHAARGAATGSGIFHGFTRSLAFASGGFVAFESVSRLLSDSVDAAREAQVAHRALGAQMKASGESWDANAEEVEKTSRAYAKFGFENDEVIASLTVLERGTGDIAQAMKLQGVVADLARAKNIDLAAAATVVAKVFGGQETALRRAVPGLHRNAHGWDLIREAQTKLAGQAAANTTEGERFHATLHDTEEIIGSGLLPVLDKYLSSLDKWLSKSENQARIQDDVNKSAKFGGEVFGALATAVGGVADAYDLYQRAADKLSGGSSFFKTLFGGTIFGQINAFANTARKLGRQLGITGGDDGNQGAARLAPEPSAQAVAAQTRLRHEAAIVAAREAAQAAAESAAARRLRGRFNIAELHLADAQLTKTLADDRRILTVEARITKEQIAQAKTLKQRTELTQKLVGITSQIASIDQQAAQAAAAAAADAKDKRDRAAEKRRQAREAAIQARQQYQTPLGLQVSTARADALAVLHPNIDGTPTGAQVRLARQVKSAALKAIRSHRLLAQGLIDAWNVVTAANTTLAASVKSQSGISGSYVAVSTRAITSGLHLSHLQRVALEQRLAQSAAHRGYRPATGYTLGQPIVVHTHVNLDGRVVATSVDKHSRTTTQRRGTRR